MNNFQENNVQAGDEALLDDPLPNEAAADAVLLPQRAHAATYEPDADAEVEVEVEVEAEAEAEAEAEEYHRPPQREHAGNTVYEDAWTQHPDADEEPEVYGAQRQPATVWILNADGVKTPEAEAEAEGAQRQPADSWRLNADGVWTTEEN